MLRTELVLPDIKELTKHQQFKYYATGTKTVKPYVEFNKLARIRCYYRSNVQTENYKIG